MNSRPRAMHLFLGVILFLLAPAPVLAKHDPSDQPTGVDEASWVSLREAVAKAMGQQDQLMAADGAVNDQFGFSVAVSGDTALVGAYFDNVGFTNRQGSAYVFTRSGGVWTQQAKLVADDGAEQDNFGYSVALFGDTALIGSYRDDVGAITDQGSAYVFTRSGGIWSQQARLVANDGAASDQFGFFVAVSGDTALVGANLDDINGNSNQGSAYVFVRNANTWTQQAKLQAGDGAASDEFGYSLALSADTAVVGAYRDDVGANVNRGSAYVFVRSGTVWTQQAQLLAGNGGNGDNFGNSVALSGETALVGAQGDNGNQGSAYVYTRSGISWTEQAQLMASDGAATDVFGYSVALSGSTALVGAPFHTVGANSFQGAAYVFARTGVTWTQQAKLLADDGAANDRFGTSVALDGGTALVGASFDGPGSAYAIGLPIADLQINKSDGTPYAIPGSFVEYEILVANAGPAPVFGARVQDPVPTGLSMAVWTCTPVQGASCPAASGSGGIDQLVDLPVDAVLRYVFSATVSAALGDTITNTATVAAPEGMIETDIANNSSSDVNSVVSDGLFANGFEAPASSVSVPIEGR